MKKALNFEKTFSCKCLFLKAVMFKNTYKVSKYFVTQNLHDFLTNKKVELLLFLNMNRSDLEIFFWIVIKIYKTV